MLPLIFKRPRVLLGTHVHLYARFLCRNKNPPPPPPPLLAICSNIVRAQTGRKSAAKYE